MKCCKCAKELEVYKIGNIAINYCSECKSVWLKFSLLKKISEIIGVKADIINPVDLEPINVKEDARICPECGKTTQKVYFNGVLLDKCTNCNAVHFDNGELAKFFRIYMKTEPSLIDNLAFLEKYCKSSNITKNTAYQQEIEIQSKEKEYEAFSINGFIMLFIFIMIILCSAGLMLLDPYTVPIGVFFIILTVFSGAGFKMLKPQEAIVLTVFGKYIGTLRGEGFHYVNPFAASVTTFQPISLKARTLDNGRQKINDSIGNPIEVGIIVIWEVQDTAKAIFNVNDYTQFLSSQSDSALRNIVRMYPYDTPEDSGVTSLRGDSQEISAKLKNEIQKNVKVAGLNIIDAKITHLAYAPEIAVAMLQRQQASAIIDAKKTIVEGAVGMVEMALNKLSNNNIVDLDNAEKAKMVNNLLVTLCSNKEAQPVIKNGL